MHAYTRYYNGLFQKKYKQGLLSIYSFEKLRGIFNFFYFTPGNPRQNKAQPLDIPQNYVRSLGNSKTKNKDTWKFHLIFSCSPLEIPFHF